MKNSGTRLSIKVVPGSSSNCIAGWMGDTLRVRVTAPAEKGKANDAVVNIVSQTLGLSKRNVAIVAGKGSPRKVIEISGMTMEEIRRLIDT